MRSPLPTPRSPLPKTIAPVPFRSPLHGFNPLSHNKIGDRTGFGLLRSHERVGFVVGFGGWNTPDKSGDLLAAALRYRTAPALTQRSPSRHILQLPLSTCVIASFIYRSCLSKANQCAFCQISIIVRCDSRKTTIKLFFSPFNHHDSGDRSKKY